MSETELGFDLETDLQGTDPEIEVDCEFWIPPVKKGSKPMKCIAIFKRADSDERKELLNEIRTKEAYQYQLEKKMAEYQGMIARLSAGEENEADIDINTAVSEIVTETEELVDWFKEMITERLLSIKGLVLKGGKKTTITTDQLPDALPALFKWDHYTQGLSGALRESLSVQGQEKARAKN